MIENTKINTSRSYIDSALKRFKLLDIGENYEEVIKHAIENKLSYREFLSKLLELETEGKLNRLKERNIKNAKFEGIKTLETFDFNAEIKIEESKVRELYNINFIEKKENIIFIGPPGVGKSHLATALGIRACELGLKVLFITAKDLIENLYRDYEKGTLKNSFNKLKKIDLLIIDELGHFMMDKEKESIFFQLIRHRYEKNSLIITTNIPLGDWSKIFSSELAATAILDRLLHHCHILSITGDSYRVKEFLMRGENCAK
ncbi:IS21-like element helper ATPase IstB [Hathewaya massiliensis]|uniref:IS21-like element helper ATPase IstB n=1 Tax=Hathewaya massiliensis TaxID=1964382 RepID=UPI001FAA6D3B|nr:IS21-like element helper ATPase IstB [Hathewaya massiliensis]